MNLMDLAFAPALTQAKLIQAGELSPLELTQLYLERIQHYDPQINSYVLVLADYALADAATKTEQLGQWLSRVGRETDKLPPFWGVPISIKDLCPVEGFPCSYGIHLLRDRIATETAGVVQLLQQAGFVLLGKTATSELGLTPYTEPRGFLPTRNPWNLDYTSGGSSGGAAAALAAGLCPVAHASDGGGSIRGPAFCCGLVGLKPSRGRVSNAPMVDKLLGLATEGALARTVADAAALLDVVSGSVAGESLRLSAPELSFLAMTERSPKPLRIALTTAFPPISTLDPACESAVTETAHLLETMGHTVEQFEYDFAPLIEPIVQIFQSGIDMGVPGLLMSRFNRWMLRKGRKRTGGELIRTLMQLQGVARKLTAQLAPYDVWLTPTYMHPTIRVGEWARLRPDQILDQIIRWIAPCPPINATGQPAIALPTGFDANGLPLGIQLVGRPADEATIISLASELERAGLWTHARPQEFIR